MSDTTKNITETINEDNFETLTLPSIFRGIGPGDDVVVSTEKLLAYVAEQRAEAAREARIDELKRLPWNYQNHAFSWHDIQDRLAQLRAEQKEWKS